jgi:hypothetical protein
VREHAFPLATVEAWMQAVVVHPDGAESGIVSAEASALIPPDRASHVIWEDGSLSAANRLEIYAGMYPLRMREALESDYPVLASLLGPRAFKQLVGDYIAAHPSTSFTMARLGDRLPEFLAAWGPARRRLLVDVVRLEHAASLVFDAEETASIGVREFEAIPATDVPNSTFRPVPAFAVVRARSGAVEALDAFLEGTKPPRNPGRGTAWVVFHRQDFTVLRRSLDPFAGQVLERLAAGETLGRALASSLRSTRLSRPAPETLSAWFRDWLTLGFFRRVERPAA